MSEKQLRANRENAKRSTGPRTPEGKARSARNACKHGFTASDFAVVRLEELDEIERLKQDLVATYQPVNSQELFALERAAIAQQTILRAARLESGLFTCCLNHSLSRTDRPFIAMDEDMVGEIEITRHQNRNYALAQGFQHLAQSKSFQLLLRYQAQAERMFRRAIEEFNRLKALREDLPNEPAEAPQPESPQQCNENETNPIAPEPDPDGRRHTPGPRPLPPSPASEAGPRAFSYPNQKTCP